MSTGLKANNDGSAAIQVGGSDFLTVTSGGNTTFTQAANLPNTFGFKNRIINGAMVIDQRNAGASVTPTNGQYAVDRWNAQVTQSSKITCQRNQGSVTPPAGFTNYLGATSSSAYSVISTDQFGLQQRVEGFNIADLAWGTANAQTITISFWVRSSLTGTFGGAVFNSTGARSYPFTYAISSANTWEQKSVTIAGDTSGTWLTDNSIGLQLQFSLGAGSSLSGTAGAWAGAYYVSATGATSVVGTNGATFYITGVQLEKGSTATSFDVRPYGTELMLCQRYYEKSFRQSTAPVAGVGTFEGAAAAFIAGKAATGVQGTGVKFSVVKRADATVTLFNPINANNQVRDNTAGGDCSSTAVTGTGDQSFYITCNGNAATAVGNLLYFHWTAAIEL